MIEPTPLENARRITQLRAQALKHPNRRMLAEAAIRDAKSRTDAATLPPKEKRLMYSESFLAA